MLPLVPVIVKVYVPDATFLLVVTVSLDVPEFTTVVGLSFALANLGSPLSVSVTVPVNPAPAVIVTVYVTVPPLLIVVALVGTAEMVKSPLTTSVTLAV